MALNSSGPISLAGTTAGQSIEVELGGIGTTQISLNDTNVRTLAGVASGQITMPTNFWGKSNSTSWIGYFSQIGQNATFTNKLDDNNFLIASYLFTTASISDLIFGYMGTNGIAGAFKRITSNTAGQTTNPRFITKAPNGYIYVAGRQYASPPSINCSVFFKFDTSLNLISSKTWYRAQYGAGSNTRAECMAFAPNGNFAVVGTSGLSASTQGAITIFDSSENLITTRNYTPANGTTGVLVTVMCASNGDFIALGNGGRRRLFVKFSSTGTLLVEQQSVLEGTSSTANEYRGGKYYDDNSIYAYGTHGDGTNVYGFIMKMNVNHSISWARQLTAYGTNQPIYQAVGMDSSGNVYYGQLNTTLQLTIIKLDPSGNIIWQRSISLVTTISNFQIWDIICIGDSYYVSGVANVTAGQNNSQEYTFKFPIDGSATGTYTINGLSLTYAVSTAGLVSYTPVGNGNVGALTQIGVTFVTNQSTITDYTPTFNKTAI